MGVESLSQFTVTLGGAKLTVIPSPDATGKGKGKGKPDPSYAGTFATQDSTKTFEKRDVPVFIRSFKRGVGVVETHDPQTDVNALAWVEDAICYLGNGIIPSGRRVSVTNHLGLGSVADPIASVIFNSHLWCPLASTGRMIRYPSANPAASPVYDPPLNTFGSATESFRTGYRPTAIEVFATAAGVPALYVTCHNIGLGATRIYQYTVAGGWSESNVLGFGISSTRLATNWWEGRDGKGAQRLHFQTTLSEIRHCIYGTDPLDPASYITPLTVGNPAYAITAMIAAPQHLYVVKQDGIHDFNELRSWNMTPYWAQNPTTTVWRRPAMLYDEHLMAVREPYGLDRYDLRLNGAQQRLPGECAPMAFMQDGTPIRGRITAMCDHEGWVLAAVQNPDNGTTYIMRGKDRRVLNVDIPNPIVWFGAEQVLPPVAGAIPTVLHMRVGPPVAATSLGGGPSYLWMFASLDNYATATNVDTVLYYAPLPSGSGPLSIQVSGGTFPFNPTARVFFTSQTWDDRNALKGVRRVDVDGRQVTATSKIEIFARSDGAPSTLRDLSTWGTLGEVAENSASLTPGVGLAAVAAGHSIALQALLTTPSPYTAPPILDAISPRAKVIRENFETRVLWVVLERDYPLKHGQTNIKNPFAVFASVVGAQNHALPLTFIDEEDRSYQVFTEQGIQFARARISPRQWRTVMRIELTIVSEN